MIDEKKLIEKLESIQKYDCKNLMERLWFDGILAIVESQPKLDEWIPIESGLPKEDGNYRVTLDDGFVTTVEFEDGEFLLWEDSGEVIAWKEAEQGYIPESEKSKELHTIEAALKACKGGKQVGEVMQYWLYLESGRSIEVILEDNELAQRDRFYSIALYCSKEETDMFKNNGGVIYQSANYAKVEEEKVIWNDMLEIIQKILTCFHETVKQEEPNNKQK